MKIAQGNTYIVKEQLKKIGMRWNGSQWVGEPDLELWEKMRKFYDGRRAARMIEQAGIEFVDREAVYHGGDINKLLANNGQPINY